MNLSLILSVTLAINYTNHLVVEDDLYIKTYDDQGTATVPCELQYSWGDKSGRYSLDAKESKVQRHLEIVHKPFGGRGQWTETEESTEARTQSGYIGSGPGNRAPRWALDLSGSILESKNGYTVSYPWNFKLCKPESRWRPVPPRCVNSRGPRPYYAAVQMGSDLCRMIQG